MTDVNEIRAGSYELVSAFWDEIHSKPGEPLDFTRHRQGDVVKLDTSEARRLVLAGAAVSPGDRERDAVARARLAYEQALAALPADVREQVLSGDAPEPVEPVPSAPPGGGSSDSTGDTGTAETGDVPAKSASKVTWVDYAVAQGMPRDEAEAMTRDELAVEYGA